MPPKDLDIQRAVHSIVRLRRAERVADDVTRKEIEPVLSYLEETVGPTVPRAKAARLLGISHTALDRWISKGDIAAVLTPQGRREIPLSQLVDLLELVEERRGDEDSMAVASVIRDLRRRAEAIDPEDLLPTRRRRPRTHRTPELHALAYHRAVARRLDERMVSDARKRLQRWREEGRMHPRWADEWEDALAMPIPKLARLISSTSERARELRQTSPFAGVLTEQERRRLTRAVEERARS